MTPQRVTLITLGVSDLQRSKNFYGAMGWKPTSEVEGQVAFYQINGLVFSGLNHSQKTKGVQMRSLALVLAHWRKTSQRKPKLMTLTPSR